MGDVRRVGGVLVLSALLAGCSASATSVGSIDDAVIDSGEVVRIDRFTSSGQTRLADGIAFDIAADGCEVTLRQGVDEMVFRLGPGDTVVLGGDQDYVVRRTSGPMSESSAPDA